LTKTGLDLNFAPTIIYAEIVFNLSTMMQAAARSYRLNQTHDHCKVIYLYYQGTMEETAVHLMSRKQRAAKLLAGDIGLTGLDALTEGEGGFEAALLNAIGREETLVDPAQLFTREDEIDVEDAAFWNVDIEDGDHTPVEPEPVSADPLLTFAQQALGAATSDSVSRGPIIIPKANGNGKSRPDPIGDATEALARSVGNYLDTVHILSDDAQRSKLQAELLAAIAQRANNERVPAVVGLTHPDYRKDPRHRATLLGWLAAWLKQQRFVFPGCEAEVAAKVVDLATQPLAVQQVKPKPVARRKPVRRGGKKIDLLAVPEEEPEVVPDSIMPLLPSPERAPEAAQQLALF